MENRELQGGEARLCPRFHHAIELIGRRWSGALIMLLVQQESARYSDLLGAIPGISDRLLSERLRELESEGIVARSVEPGPPVRVSYRLTDAGRALEPAIYGLARWADTWIPDPRDVAKTA
jgi:DNA-binding HxlR family transcriptional regulator